MEVKFIDLYRENYKIKEECLKLFSDIIEENSFVGGKYVEEFEKNFAKFCGVKHAISVNSGTDALILSLSYLLSKDRRRKKVITTPFTFFATAEAIKRAGGEVVFCDISNEDLNIDVNLIESLIDDETVGILPVHIFGMPCEMDTILKVAEKGNLWVLEDACQAHGATYKGRKVGSLGDIGVFSFYPTKNLNGFGDGGIIVTNNDEIAENLNLLKNHGQKARYSHEFLGFNSRLDGIQAAILNKKLRNLEDYNNHRYEMAKFYCKNLNGIGDIVLPAFYEHKRSVFHLFTIRTKYRDKLIDFLREKGIGCGVYYPVPLYRQKPFFENLDYLKKFPITEKVVKEVVSLPLYNEIREDEVLYVSEAIKEFFRR